MTNSMPLSAFFMQASPAEAAAFAGYQTSPAALRDIAYSLRLGLLPAETEHCVLDEFGGIDRELEGLDRERACPDIAARMSRLIKGLTGPQWERAVSNFVEPGEAVARFLGEAKFDDLDTGEKEAILRRVLAELPPEVRRVANLGGKDGHAHDNELLVGGFICYPRLNVLQLLLSGDGGPSSLQVVANATGCIVEGAIALAMNGSRVIINEPEALPAATSAVFLSFHSETR